MLQTNLLKSKPRISGVSDGRDLVFLFFKIFFVLFILVGALVFVFRTYRGNAFFSENTQSQEISRDSFQNTQDSKPQDREESIMQADDETGDGPYYLAYEDMTILEQIHYEGVFTKVTLDFFISSVPPSASFEKLRIRDFKIVSGVVFLDTREDVVSFLRAFEKSPDWTIRPRPETRLLDKNDYFSLEFIFEHRIPASVLSENLEVDENIFGVEHLERMKNHIRSAVDTNGLMASDLRRISADSRGKYRDLQYRLQGSTTFSQFVYFVHDLYNSTFPLRFSEVTLETSESGVDFDVTITVTVFE
jgi:hypothetical protein